MITTFSAYNTCKSDANQNPLLADTQQPRILPVFLITFQGKPSFSPVAFPFLHTYIHNYYSSRVIVVYHNSEFAFTRHRRSTFTTSYYSVDFTLFIWRTERGPPRDVMVQQGKDGGNSGIQLSNRPNQRKAKRMATTNGGKMHDTFFFFVFRIQVDSFTTCKRVWNASDRLLLHLQGQKRKAAVFNVNKPVYEELGEYGIGTTLLRDLTAFFFQCKYGCYSVRIQI